MPPSPPPELTDADLARRLNAALYIPIALLVVIGGLLYAQVTRLSSSAEWMDHSDKVIGKVDEAQKLIIDQETGIRGYLVTNDRTFLQPFNEAHPRLFIADLHALVADNPPQQARVAELRQQYEAWLDEEAKEVLRAGELGAAREDSVMLTRKKEMDSIRAVIDAILETEKVLRRERTVAVQEANSNAQLVIVGLLLAAGVVIAFLSRGQMKSVAESFGGMLTRERSVRATLEQQDWMRAAEMRVAASIHGDLLLGDIGARVLEGLASETGAEVGAFYVVEPGGLRRHASHAIAAPEHFAMGEGLVGQVVVDKKTLHVRDVPHDFMRVRSGSGERDPVEIVVAPALTDGTVHAVMELGFLHSAPARALELLDRIGEVIAIAVRSADYRRDLRRLLDETQAQASVLQSQQEELRVTNEELEEQSSALQNAQKELELQQVELEQTNENLDQHARLLGHQNDNLKRAQEEIEQRATEVARSNQYKSEFLANMSHELRTPLNSALILSKLLSDNKGGNLTSEQVKFAETIYAAGNDLLTLINDILDLSKIEAGKMDVEASASDVARVVEPVLRMFEPLATQKGITFETKLENLGAVETDVAKVQQILKNLLSNAFKFTERGGVTLHVSGDAARVVVKVTDTGIGIADGQLGIIFDAFRQADGTTNRRYGGTGLGLSISRDLARLLGGDLSVESRLDHGSMFMLTFPRVYVPPSGPLLAATGSTPTEASPRREAPVPRDPQGVSDDSSWAVTEQVRLVDDDRDALDPSARLVLVVEDDPAFARILVDLCRQQGFQCVVSGSAAEAVRLAADLLPRAILLDMHLPDHSGLTVLDRLKRSAPTRHIPVHVLSVADHSRAALAMGAAGYALKPVDREQIVAALRELEARWSPRTRRVLVVEDDSVQREAIEKLLGSPDVMITAVATVHEALEQLKESTFDCVVTDLSLPDESGYDLLERIANDDAYSFPPVIVYTGRSLTREEELRLRKFSSNIIVKGARSPERLLDEVTLFLHQVESSLSPERQRMLKQVRDREAVFEGRHVLIVEDDVRNIFALTSVLEPKGAVIEIARNGKEALAVLERGTHIDLVLMDVMMPEMDGITCIREIRKNRDWSKLPIIALTAKAMKDDHDRCLSAGASDYISKPLDVETLLSLVRVWMPK